MQCFESYILKYQKNDIKWLIKWHQGGLEFLWPYYPPTAAVFILLLVISGTRLQIQSNFSIQSGHKSL